jgi:hypothetical protein
MARPKGKPFQDGKPTVEEKRIQIGIDRPKLPRPEYVASAIVGILARPGVSHPQLMSTAEIDGVMESAFDIAEVAEEVHKRRYG